MFAESTQTELYAKGRLSFTPEQGTIECAKEDCCWASSLLARPWQWQRLLLLPRRWSEFQPGSQCFCPEVLCPWIT